MKHYAAGLGGSDSYDDDYDYDEDYDNAEEEEEGYDEDYEEESIYSYDPEKQKTFAAFWSTALIIAADIAAIGVLVEFIFITKQRSAMVLFADIVGSAGLPLHENLSACLQAVAVLVGFSLVLSAAALGYFGRQRAKEAKEGFVADPRKGFIAKAYAGSVIFLAVLSAVFVVFSLLFLGIISDVVTDPVDLVVKEDTAQKMFDFEVAVFNECCAAANFSEQGVIQQCVQNLAVDCSNLPSGLDAFQANLCACYDSASVYNALQARIAESTLCADLNDIPVTITQETSIPGIPVSITFIITSLYPGVVLPSSAEIPVVGFPGFDPNGGDQFGCGIGYAKGFMFILSIWAEQSISLSLYILIGIQLLLILLAVAILTCLRVSTDDWIDETFMQEPLLAESNQQQVGTKLQTPAVHNVMYQEKDHEEEREPEQKREEGERLLEESEKSEAIHVGEQSTSAKREARGRRRRKRRNRRPVTGQFIRSNELVFDDYVVPQELAVGRKGEDDEEVRNPPARTKPQRPRRRRKKKLVEGEFIKG